MGYNFSLLNLAKLTDEEFQAIPACPREVAEFPFQPTKIKTGEQRWLYDLCRDISPNHEESVKSGRPFPKYIPYKTYKIGGEAIIFSVWNAWQKRHEICKVPLPIAAHDAQARSQEKEPKQQEDNRIVQGAQKLLQVTQGLYRRLEKPKKKQKRIQEFPKKTKEEIERETKDQITLRKSSAYERQHRSYVFQEQVFRKAAKVDPDRNYGFVPACYEFGFHPKCYFSMEKIDGESWIDYICKHSDAENFNLFLRLVIFIEKAIHPIRIAHCDLDHENIIVVEKVPCVLDFGIAKGENLPSITLSETQLGKPTAQPDQLKDSVGRSYSSDIYALGHLLWITICREKQSPAVVAAEIGVDGKLVIDEELMCQIFPSQVLPEGLREIFELTQVGGYQEISELRRDLESLSLGAEVKKDIECKQPCDEVLKLRKFFKILLE